MLGSARPDVVLLDVRVGGALEAILSGAVAELAERYAVLAVALWPPTYEVSLRDMPERAERVGRGWPADVKADAVAAYRSSGESYAKVGARFGVPGCTLKDWVRKAQSAAS